MKIFLLSDDTDTLTGFKLVGVAGKAVQTEAEFLLALANIEEEAAILMITDNLARRYAETIKAFRQSRTLPLVVEIPSRQSTGPRTSHMAEYMREALGVHP